MQKAPVRFLGQEDPLEKGTATLSSILAWRIPWTEAPGRLYPWVHKESDTTQWLALHCSYECNSSFLRDKCHGMHCCLWGHLVFTFKKQAVFSREDPPFYFRTSSIRWCFLVWFLFFFHTLGDTWCLCFLFIYFLNLSLSGIYCHLTVVFYVAFPK